VISGSASRSRGIKYGYDLLDRLDELRHDMLTDMFHHDRLIALRYEIKERRITVEDPRLMAILDDIDLKASVEVAKLGITQTGNYGKYAYSADGLAQYWQGPYSPRRFRILVY